MENNNNNFTEFLEGLKAMMYTKYLAQCSVATGGI